LLLVDNEAIADQPRPSLSSFRARFGSKSFDQPRHIELEQQKTDSIGFAGVSSSNQSEGFGLGDVRGKPSSKRTLGVGLQSVAKRSPAQTRAIALDQLAPGPSPPRLSWPSVLPALNFGPQQLAGGEVKAARDRMQPSPAWVPLPAPRRTKETKYGWSLTQPNPCNVEKNHIGLHLLGRSMATPTGISRDVAP